MITAEERAQAASDMRGYYGTDAYHAMVRFLSAEAEFALLKLLNAQTEKESDMHRGAVKQLQLLVIDMKRNITE